MIVRLTYHRLDEVSGCDLEGRVNDPLSIAPCSWWNCLREIGRMPLFAEPEADQMSEEERPFLEDGSQFGISRAGFEDG